MFSLTCDVKTSRVLQRADTVCTVQGLGIMELAVTLPCVAPMFIPALLKAIAFNNMRQPDIRGAKKVIFLSLPASLALYN